MKTGVHFVFIAVCLSLSAFAADAPKKDAPPTGPVSYYKQIRPIFQANCQGCHQPAKAKGGYIMTDFIHMLAGGENKDKTAAIVPKDAAKSLLIQQITPEKEKAEMPKGKPPLLENEIALVTRWINEGASDDTPDTVKQRFDAEHPPEYTLPPVITSLDFSSDGQYLAVAGFHEVLLHKPDGSGMVGRLVGLSERIETVRFSPDAKLLAVAGGNPSRMGEIQIWDVEKRKLKISVPITYDTVYGVNWSPDGKLVSFGCADFTVRAIEVETGKQVLQQGSHNDWVLDTAFSLKGDYIISVGRDMSAKLTEVATQRFVDNITSITPGALRGGLHSVSRHPAEDLVLVGGADGAPQIYRIIRLTARKIGDNANLIRKFPEMTGRIFSARYNKDGKQFAAASALDNNGEIVIYEAGVDATIPEKIKKILDKTVDQYSAEDKMELDKYHNEGTKQLAKVEVKGSGMYAVAFSPDGATLAAAGQDGLIRLIKTTDGSIAKQFDAAPVNRVASDKKRSAILAAHSGTMIPALTDKEDLPNLKIASLDVQPAEILLTKPTDGLQLLITAKFENGDTMDVTRIARIKAPPFVELTPRGHLSPSMNGKDKLKIEVGKAKAQVPVTVSGQLDDYKIDFIRDVAPVLSRAGCNMGTCHGSKDGKNGFKLSLRGYDPVMDVRAFGDDLASRRVNAASPDDSLMLLKPTSGVPHEGGQRLKLDDKYYQIIREWIANGAQLNSDSAHVTSIDIFPKNPVIQSIGSKQQIRVVATYANGETRDVTSESFLDSGNNDVATADSTGLITTVRRGEAPVLARFEGSYAATTITVMGDRTGFEWQEPPTNGRVDELVAAKWKRMKILPSELCTDTEFIRRVYLDLTGLPPAPEDVLAFQSDSRETQAKRAALVDKLIGTPEYVEHWANKWADLLQLNRKFLGTEGAPLFRDWIRKQIETNVPYDQFVRSILTATGSNKDNPPSSYFKVLREPAETMENTTHLFLATRFNCNKCHDHPFERWTQDQYYQTAAFFAQIELKSDPASGDKKIGGSAVEGAKPLYEIVTDKKQGDVTHLRTNKVAPPKFPYPATYELKDKEKATRREELAAWMTSPDNRYFAMSYVNRIWGYLTGVGIIEPLDDIRAGNPPTNPELLEFLTKEFLAHNFDVRHIQQLICKSRTYQLSIVPNKWNNDDKTNYSHGMARRLPAEVLYDAVFKVTGSTANFPGVKPGTRAAQLPDSGIDLPSGFLAALGRPPRESSCECERSNDIRLGSVMSLLSGPAVSDAINDANNGLAKLVAAQPDDRKLVNDIFIRVLNRPATESEISSSIKNMNEIDGENQKLTTDLAEMEKKYEPIIAAQEKARLESIEKAKTDLADYEKSIAAKVAEDEKKRLERVAAAEKALADYEPLLTQKTADWEKALTAEQKANGWIPMEFKEVKPSNGAVKLEKQKDGTILASGQRQNTDYVLTTDVTTLTNITGLKLEVLPHESFPKSGPGRADDGNFVLNLFRLELAPKTDDKKFEKQKFKDAKADFTQKDFDIKVTIGEKFESGKGWAISGTPPGGVHQAVFAFEKPVGDEKGAILKVTMAHKFQDPYGIGRFRIWYTTSATPLEFGLPKDIAEIVNTAADKRTKEQTDALLAYVKATDAELLKKQQTLTFEKKPLPIDPKVTEKKATLAKSEEPIKIEPKLIQMRADAEASKKQMENKRLTGAQDLTWALINNSSFLFNH